MTCNLEKPEDGLDVSIVVPLYNEEDNVRLLYHRIVEAADSLGRSYELIFVDDGSSDSTFALAAELAGNDDRLRVLKILANAGQTQAMVAGIRHAEGKVIVTMDGDLQNDPRDIESFLTAIDQGYDIVVGWRHDRKDKLLTRKIPSMIANRLIGRVTGVPIRDNGCSLKAYRSEVVKNIPLYSEMHRFIPAMCSLSGARICELRVRHHARQFGQSKYGLSRVYKVCLDLITVSAILSIMRSPMLFFLRPALIFAAVGVLTLIAGQQLHSFVLSSVGILAVLTGTVYFFWGLVAELILATGNQSRARFAGLTIRDRGER